MLIDALLLTHLPGCHPMLALTCHEEDIDDKPRERAEAEVVISRKRLFAMEAAFLCFY